MEENPITRLVWLCMLAAADRHGVVDATHAALARRFNLPRSIVKKAIALLEEPDDNSRTPDCEGRRLVRLEDHRNWGWKVVNYELYRRARDPQERREYKRKHEANRRAKCAEKAFPYPELDPGCGQELSTNVHVDSRGPNAEAEAEAEADAEADPDCDPKGSLVHPTDECTKQFELIPDEMKPESLRRRFDRIWAAYPRKTNKKKAYQHWKRLPNCSYPNADDVVTWIERAKKTRRWIEGYVPDGATFFSQRRWDDDLAAYDEQTTRSRPATGIQQPLAESQTESSEQILSNIRLAMRERLRQTWDDWESKRPGPHEECPLTCRFVDLLAEGTVTDEIYAIADRLVGWLSAQLRTDGSKNLEVRFEEWIQRDKT